MVENSLSLLFPKGAVHGRGVRAAACKTEPGRMERLLETEISLLSPQFMAGYLDLAPEMGFIATSIRQLSRNTGNVQEATRPAEILR